jgi:hypothetical protein
MNTEMTTIIWEQSYIIELHKQIILPINSYITRLQEGMNMPD